MRTFNVNSNNAVISISSNGNLMKWCIEENGKQIFIKSSSIDRQTLQLSWMYESYSEVICSKLFKELGIDNIVQYYLCEIIIDNKIKTIGCYSYSFLKSYEHQVTIVHLIKTGKISNYATLGYNGYTQCIEEIKALTNIDYKNEINKILTLDFLTLNQDRHLGNLGFIYNSKTGNIRIQDIFDNGDSLFSTKRIEEMNYTTDLDEYIRSKPFIHSHYEQLKYTNFEYVKNLNFNIENTLIFIESLNNKGLNMNRIRFIEQLLITRINILKSFL